MTSPVYEPPGTTSTAADLALLRRLLQDVTEPQRNTDSELGLAILGGPKVPQQWNPISGLYEPLIPGPDLYGLAADLWELRALEQDVAGVEDVRVKSDRNGDVARTYAGQGKATGEGVLTGERCRSIAKALRRRSPNHGAQTVVVQTGYRREPLWGDTGLYRSQAVN